MSVIVCLSHKEDVDGISSAALIKAAFRTKKIVLVDYANIISNLEELADLSSVTKNKIHRIFICDLGLSKKNEQKFIDIVGNIISNGTAVTYIDHHDLSKDTAISLMKIGVELIHTDEECTSVQIYNKYKNKLEFYAAFVAAAGALTDYMEHKPIASPIVSRFDRQFLMLEATALSYMISASQRDNKFLVKIVNTLAKMKYPHEIKGGFSLAEKYAKKVSEAVKSIEKSMIRIENLAYVHSNSELSASMIVNFVLGTSEKPVAMVYKLKNNINSYVISIRASPACKFHIGRLVNDIASDIGGSGGGHDKASGAVIPKEKLEQFIQLLNKQIANDNENK
jgi:oligoribonuclease NrnB/cAMP/cGMP phosphodiesterase (DHH superfamily)